MTDFINSLVMICPSAALQQVQAIGPLLGNSAGEFSVALSADGSGPATHYGLHAAASSQYVNLVRDLSPEEFEARYTQPDGTKLVTASQVSSLRAALIISACLNTELNGSAHFDAVLVQAGLKRIVDTSGLDG